MNKKIWDKFINGECCIEPSTEEEADKFVNLVYDEGYRWVWEKESDVRNSLWKKYGVKRYYMTFDNTLNACGSGRKIEEPIYTYKELMEDDKPDYMENKFGIKKDSIYRITYKSLKNIRFGIRLKDCELKRIKGNIVNYNPMAEVVINTDKGLQILSYRQIVEMVVD